MGTTGDGGIPKTSPGVCSEPGVSLQTSQPGLMVGSLGRQGTSEPTCMSLSIAARCTYGEPGICGVPLPTLLPLGFTALAPPGSTGPCAWGGQSTGCVCVQRQQEAATAVLCCSGDGDVEMGMWRWECGNGNVEMKTWR